MAPAVFVPKKPGAIQLCIDYRESSTRKLRKMHITESLQDEVQDWLSGSTVFSILDLQSGYWQLPVDPSDQEKTAVCSGPGMGLYQFKWISFRLTGASSSFQRIMNKVLRGLQLVTIYLGDILVHPSDEQTHWIHLQNVFKILIEAGLTLQGRKCHMDYLNL